MSVKPVQFPSGDLQLEGILFEPDALANGAAIVVCHPHPLRGGDMRNNVVMAAARALLGAGLTVLTFNFRGVGASTGTHDEGIGEQDDLRAALAYAASLDGIDRIGLAGYSFGAGVASHVSPDYAASPVALISLPTASADTTARIEAITAPLFLISGDDDHVSFSEPLLTAAANRPDDLTEVAIVPGVDHFWRGAEPLLEQRLAAFFTTRLATPLTDH
jgi:alpha/beta superfamily hydrolase